MAYAYSADPDQTAPERAVWSESSLFAIPLSILRHNCINILEGDKKYTVSSFVKCLSLKITKVILLQP